VAVIRRWLQPRHQRARLAHRARWECGWGRATALVFARSTRRADDATVAHRHVDRSIRL